MAFRFGGKQLAGAGAGRVLLGASTAQIRGYCQQASSAPECTVRRGAMLFVTGAVSALTVCHLLLRPKLNAAREKARARRLYWEALKK